MDVDLSCIVVDADPANQQEMVTFLADAGVDVVARLTSLVALDEALASAGGVQMVMVSLDPTPQENLREVGCLVRQYPDISFFVLSQSRDADLLMEAMHLGVREFAPLPVQPEKLLAGIQRVAELRGLGHRARVIHVIPTVGGCGSTTIACNVAASLAGNGRTVLVDLDLARGAVASAFDLTPRYSIADLLESTHGLDRQLLNNALMTHEPTGLSVLARPTRLEQVSQVQPGPFKGLMRVLTRIFDYVVLDSQMSLEPLYRMALESADLNVLVVQLNVPSARNAARFLDGVRRLGIDGRKIKVVVNRASKKEHDVEPEELQRTLNVNIDWSIPNDFRSAIESINFGQPVVLRSPKAELSSNLVQLAHALNGAHNK